MRCEKCGCTMFSCQCPSGPTNQLVEDGPIHNGEKRQWNCLEVIDRASGEVERIRLDDGNSAASVAIAAENNNITVAAAWDVLLAGGTVATFGYVRRLA